MFIKLNDKIDSKFMWTLGVILATNTLPIIFHAAKLI